MRPSRPMSPLERELRERIARDGPIKVADYMAACNAHYYATRDPLGVAGDFTTAPEISQMFGELVGAWLADLWERAGRPEGAAYVELGPGRGTLGADALRVMRKAGLEPEAHLVEMSPVLRRAQAVRLPGATWHDDVKTLPDTGPLLIVANEFFDALPVRQFDAGGRELTVTAAELGFLRWGDATREDCPAGRAIVAALAARLARQGGALLIIDYGYDRPGRADTLQAMSRHAFTSAWTAPGEADLTAHVDFAALAGAAGEARISGPLGQGAWLQALGIEQRAAALIRAQPARAAEIEAARSRLVSPDRMGELFKAMAISATGWPEPAGFAR